MTELQFLIDLLLNHKLTASTKKLISERIKVVESELTTKSQHRPMAPSSAQAPSTQRILDEMTQPEPVTQAAAQALQSRSAAIKKAIDSGPFGGKPEPGRTSPRKF